MASTQPISLYGLDRRRSKAVGKHSTNLPESKWTTHNAAKCDDERKTQALRSDQDLPIDQEILRNSFSHQRLTTTGPLP